MQASDKCLQEFLDAVCKEIRFKGVHSTIRDELADHISEQKREYINHGIDDETAGQKAVEQMGDPLIVGKQLDMAHRPKTEWSVLFVAALLVVAGGALQFFLSRVSENNAGVFFSFLKYAAVGIPVFLFMYFFDYTLLGRYSRLICFMLLAATFAGFLVLFRVNGAFRHVYASVLLFIPVYSGIIYSFKNKGFSGIIVCGLFYGGAAFACLIAPRLSALLLLTVACLILLTVAVVKGYFGVNKVFGLLTIYFPLFTAMEYYIFNEVILDNYEINPTNL